MNRARIVYFLLCGLLFISYAPTTARAQSAEAIQAQIDANNKQIEALQIEIAAFQKELDIIGAKKDTLQSAISSLTISQKKLASEIKVTQSKIASANLKIKELSLSISDKEETITTDQNAIAKALRDVAEDEQSSLVIQLISSNSMSDAWQAADHSLQFNRALADDINHLRTVRAALATKRGSRYKP